MFNVGPQQLSMPLVEMSGVLAWPETLTRLPGTGDITVGVFQYRGKNVQIVDSAKLFGIKRKKNELPARIIVLQGEQWAITADEIHSVVSVEKNDVKWSSAAASTKTLGTIRDSLASLLNPAGISQLLESGGAFKKQT